MPKMRAKMRVNNVEKGEGYELLTMNAVAKDGGYPDDGSDENNSFARWTPDADLRMDIRNPELHGRFEVGQEFYVDFTPAA